MRFQVVVCILSVCLYSSHPPQVKTPSEDSAQTPLYAKYYDQVLALEKAGKPAEALAAIPKVYEAEIPVDAFYETLDKKKRSLLQVLIESTESKSDLEAYNLYFHSLLLRADRLKSVFMTSSDLPPERFFYLQVILNNYERRTKETNFIESPDPWLVASTLFLARKTGSSLTPNLVVKSWQKNIHLWDDVCVEQALLYLARYTAADLKKIPVENEDVRVQINQLSVPQPGMGEVQLLTFSQIDRKPGLRLTASKTPLNLTLQTLGENNEILVEQKLDKNAAITEILALRPGKYRFSHVEGSAGTHGEYAGTFPGIASSTRWIWLASSLPSYPLSTATARFMEIIAGV
ncbi:hypothetical protein ACFLT9_12950 [Acidobacteriota bacterium]